jgi:hypothetical protein
MEKAKREKKLPGSLVHIGPGYGCSGPSPIYEIFIYLKGTSVAFYHKSCFTLVVRRPTA